MKNSVLHRSAFDWKICASDYLINYMTDLAEAAGLDKNEIHIEMEKTNADGLSSVRVGTTPEPLYENSFVVRPDCRLVVRFNAERIERVLRKTEPLDGRFVYLWGILTQALRLYAIGNGTIMPDELLPASLFKTLKLPNISSAIGISYVVFDWDEKRMRREIDIAIMAAGIARIIRRTFKRQETLDLRFLSNIIIRTKRSDWQSFLAPVRPV